MVTKSIDLTRKKITFREELSYVLTKNVVMLVFLVAFFSRQLTFTLLAASISHSLTAVMKFFFFSTKFVSFIFNHPL